MKRGVQPVQCCIMMLFGAGGDLCNRKLMPSLYNLARDGLLPANFVLIGNARKDLSNHQFRNQMKKVLQNLGDTNEDAKEDSKNGAKDGESDRDQIIEQLIDKFYYVPGDSTDAELYKKLQSTVDKAITDTKCAGNILFYLATPPQLFSIIPEKLSQAGLLKEENGCFRRVVLEKPFGHDYASAKKLNHLLGSFMKEKQIYRIDHYLGKETVQNIMALRFANTIFEPLWNNHHIDSIQITVSETLGVQDRGGYYDTAGALRDMVPNHLFQLVSLIAMEAPNSFEADDVLDEKVKLIKAIKPFTPWSAMKRTVRGQYAGYTEEANVNPNSETETFVAMKLEIDNWRWAGVPFYLRTGKKLGTHDTEVVIQFRHVPIQMFRDTIGEGLIEPNLLTIQLYPKEQITLGFAAKTPGTKMRLSDVKMLFDYETEFGTASRTGYETLLFDAIIGDRTLFQRADQVEASWKVVEPILEAWDKSQSPTFPNYTPGSSGPPEAQALLAQDGRYWRERQIPKKESKKKAA
jgi:glucose-6-phosphate 1-dehydrogenase